MAEPVKITLIESMNTDYLETTTERPLRMVKEKDELPPPLLNWPPEKPHEMPKFVERKSYGFYKFLFLAGLASYFYWKFHGG